MGPCDVVLFVILSSPQPLDPDPNLTVTMGPYTEVRVGDWPGLCPETFIGTREDSTEEPIVAHHDQNVHIPHGSWVGQNNTWGRVVTKAQLQCEGADKP